MPPRIDAVTVLHLSDLHVGGGSEHEPGRLVDALRRGLVQGPSPDILVVSGDLSAHGRRDELDGALEVIRALLAAVDLPPRRAVVVPGRTDVNHHKSVAYFAERAAEDLPPERPYFPKLSFYKQLFDRLYEGQADLSFTEAEPWTFFAYPELGTVVAGLDATLAESHRDADHHPFLGEAQLRSFVEKIRPYEERGFLRLGVTGHDPAAPPLPGAEQDAADLARILLPRLNVVLHGEAPEARLTRFPAEVLGFGVGPAAGPNLRWLEVHGGGVRWKRSGGATEEIAATWARIEAIGAHSPAEPMPERIDVVERHRRAVARDQGMPTVFDLLGVNQRGERAAGLDFLRVFVPQHAAREEPRRPRRTPFDDNPVSPLPAEPLEESPALFDRLPERPETVDTLLAGRRLFLIGAPGAGKTALTRWLLLKLCVPGESLPGFADEIVPVRVEMRRFDEGERTASAAGRSYDVLAHVDGEHAEHGWPLRGASLRDLARDGRIYWLFDGLDEVIDEDRRRRHAQTIARLFEVYDKCQGVVTSRSAGADVARPSLEGAGFATYALQGFVDAQRDQLLDAWHALVFAHDPDVGRHRRARIAQAIEAAPSLRELCRSPLLCALLAYLNREEELPHRRHRLYQKILERMAEHWDANKGLPKLPGAERFELDDKLVFLRRLAWQMLAGEGGTAGNAIEQGELEAFAARFCEERWEVRPETAREAAEVLIRQLRERNAVLAFFGGTTYGFAHRTFFEYLAAVEAHERFRDRVWEIGDLEKIFARHWDDPVWEEPLMLLCGLLAEGNPDYVVRVLQGIVAEDMAVVYGALDEHLAFCIKALGELPRLDRGLPLEFVRAINDIIEFQIRNPPLPDGETLQGAFRRRPNVWPGVERLLRATQEVLEGAPSRSAADLFFCWLYAAGNARRVDIIAAALKYSGVPAYLLTKEASSLGSWSSDEVGRVCEIADGQSNESYRTGVLNGLVSSPWTHWSDDNMPIIWLRERAASSVSAAYRLAAIECCREEGLRRLRVLATSESSVAFVAAEQLARLGHGTGVIPVLQRSAMEGHSIVGLAKLARDNRDAKVALGRTVSFFCDKASDPNFFAAVAASAKENLWIFSDKVISQRIRALKDVTDKIYWLTRLQVVPGLVRFVIRQYDVLVKKTRSSVKKVAIVIAICNIDSEQGGSDLRRLRLRLLGSSDLLVAIETARVILDVERDPEVRGRARALLRGYLEDSWPEGVRFYAAEALGLGDAVGRRVIADLARTAQEGAVRLAAACLAADIRVLNALAQHATEERLSKEARRALDLYGHLDWLRKVGRPRRARIRFRGHDVGVLEETTTLGGPTRFLYSPDYLATPGARPIAPNLKLRAEAYESPALHPYFANLLPEGTLYAHSARRLGLKREDRFGVLLGVGADVMGAVEVLDMRPV